VAAYVDKRRDLRAWKDSAQTRNDVYRPAEDWQERLHEWLDADHSSEDTTKFDAVWQSMAQTIGVYGQGNPEHAQIGLAFDAVPSFAKGVWCAVRHLAPKTVIETGVARGITSRILLEGLEHNQHGHLWSIDLPHPANYQLGAAVTPDLRPRWTLKLGTSKAILPTLLSQLGTVDLFIHDSLHTGRNVEFELRAAWPHLREGGVLLADDIDHSFGFHNFVQNEHVTAWFAARRDDGGMWGLAFKPQQAS
jgi:hypothetical protein